MPRILCFRYMKFLLKLFTCCILLAAIPLSVRAQTRGEGVGALLGNFVGTTKISVSDGKTAPRATVFVENAQGEIQVEAALDEQGIFTFTFGTEEVEPRLYIFASDTVASTKKIIIDGRSVRNFILPPTIVAESKPTTAKTVIYGYTFPGASIRLTVRSTDGVLRQSESTADDSSGKWTVTLPQLEKGRYTAVAIASTDNLESEESSPITIDVGVSTLYSIVRAVAPALVVPAAVVTLAPPGFAVGDIPYYLTRLLLFLRGLIFFWKRRRVRWGVIYDGLTKNPISGAIVRLYRDAGGLIETEVTGKAGVFSFLPQPGRYTIRVAKPGYIFPSTLVEGTIDGEYELVYHGEVFDVRDFKTPISISVALDPKDQSVQGIGAAFRSFRRRYGIVFQVFIVVLGVCISAVTATFDPAWYNFLLIILYALLFMFLIYKTWRDSTVWGKVIDEQGKPVPLVSLSLLETMFHRQVQRRVTDIYGRYQFVVSEGTYSIFVSSAGWELVPSQTSYSGMPIRVTKQADLVKPTVVVRKKR